METTKGPGRGTSKHPVELEQPDEHEQPGIDLPGPEAEEPQIQVPKTSERVLGEEHPSSLSNPRVLTTKETARARQ